MEGYKTTLCFPEFEASSIYAMQHHHSTAKSDRQEIAWTVHEEMCSSNQSYSTEEPGKMNLPLLVQQLLNRTSGCIFLSAHLRLNVHFSLRSYVLCSDLSRQTGPTGSSRPGGKLCDPFFFNQSARSGDPFHSATATSLTFVPVGPVTIKPSIAFRA